ncbi:hypothetical protein Rhow_004618 [Rhodococcus wratislaviensis]|uniref:Uncharacterized protein n=1 Tax=Rhodococcus wratislaviensis TaxID=44752 RepID=A0A402CBF5_RHOWR|nr:hypothetical protein Rhow_004618 [Rhodococcus wratislaviensis]
MTTTASSGLTMMRCENGPARGWSWKQTSMSGRIRERLQCTQCTQ